MDAYTLGRAALAMYTSMLLAAIVTAWMLGYARRRGMLDAPGQRRSHVVPTPRGGGLGLVVGSIAGIVLALHGQIRPPILLWVMLASGVLVALVGWIDDRSGLSPWPRLLAHLGAVLAFAALLVPSAHWSWWWLPPLLLAGAWSINLHNFMDGIDGILGLQLLFTGLLGALLCVLDGMPVLATAQLVASAAASGFLAFNFPPARIFMGDVGSGYAGLLVFMLAALWCANDPHALWPVLAMHAVFVTDASLTLLSRMLRGRRWYTAHREHLYQWMVRSGFSHGTTGCLYMSYNVILVAPAAWLAWRRPDLGPVVCAATYLLATLAWWLGRGYCLRRIARGGRDAPA